MFSPLDFKLTASRRLAALLALPYGLALAVIWASAAPLPLQILATLIAAWSLRSSLWQLALLRGATAVTGLTVDTQRQPGVTLTMASGQRCSAELQGDSITLGRWALLKLRASDNRRLYWVLVCPFNTDLEHLRRLRVLLNFGLRRHADKSLTPD